MWIKFLLLDAHLEKTITSEEYIIKKNKIFARNIEAEQKLKDFEQQGNRWLERARKLIKSAHQAKIIALQENFSELKNFLQKVGSTLLLRKRAVSASLKNDWQILANQSTERRSHEAHPLTCSKWLDKWNDFRLVNWLDILEFPELTLQYTQQLLGVLA